MSDLPEISSRISPRLVKIFMTVAVLTIGLFGSLVWYTWDTFRYLETTQKNYFRLTELSGSIVHLDEVLTMSARMAAATGEQTWEARYRGFETKLDAAIKEAMVLGQEFSLKDAAEKTDTANLKLVDMENQAFDLVRKGQTEKAAAILSSIEYDVQKKIYISGIEQITETIRGNLEKNISEYRHRGYLAISSILLVTPCLVFGWILVARLIRQYNTNRKRMEEALRRNREEAERLAEEMAVIAEIGLVISSTLNIVEVYERFAAETHKLIPSDSLSVNLYNFQENTLCVAYVSGLDIDGRRPGDPLVLEGSLSETVIRTRTSLCIQPASIDEIVGQFPRLTPIFQAGLSSLMCVPLVYRDKVIAVLHFRSKKQNAYTEQDLQLAERIGIQIAGAIANAQLYADLKKTENSLRESEGRFRSLFEQAAVGGAEIEMSTGRFFTVNRRLCEMMGRTEEEMLATTFQAITHPEDSRLHEGKTQIMLAGEIDHYSLEKRYLRKDGGIVWVNITVSPLWKPGEAPGRIIIVAEDITERKRMEKALQRAHEELEQRVADRTEELIRVNEELRIEITERNQAEKQLQDTLESLRKAVGATIQVMVSAVETRDPYTSGHQIRSADLARAIATEMELPQDKIDAIRMSGSIHDIGKLSIPAEILSKPTKLSEIEFSLIREHAKKGYEMLKDVESPWPLAEIVHQHHERMNGSGYPRNLKGEEILIEARILAVADVVEAMASHRPYRAGLGIDAALNEIEKNRGIFYDNAVADACLRLFREKGFQLEAHDFKQ